MLNVQILRENVPVAINWNLVTLASLWETLPKNHLLMSTGKHIVEKNVSVFDGLNETPLLTGDVVKAWR